ncbi:MAG: methyl-accepting chemotaxis protein, partial [Deefgea sp.]
RPMFDRISTRLIVGFGLLLSLMMVIIAISLFSVQNIQSASAKILQQDVAIGDLAQDLRYLVTRTRQKEKSIFLGMGVEGKNGMVVTHDEWEELITEMDKAIAHFATQPLSPELKAIASQMPNQLQSYRSAVNTVYGQIQAGQLTTPQQADAALEPYKQPLRDLGDNVKQSYQITHKNVQIAQSAIAERAQQTRNSLITMGAIALLFGVAAALLIARSIITPLNAMQAEIVAIDQSSDLTRRLPLNGGAELKTMAQAMNRLLGSLNGTLSDLQRQSDQLKGSAQQLSSTSAQVKSSSERQSDESTSMAAALEEISTSISHIADLSNDAHQMSQQSGLSAKEGAQHIDNMVVDINKIAESIRHAAISAEELDSSSVRISSI